MFLNYSAIVKKPELVRTMLIKQYIRKTLSSHKTTKNHCQKLNATQKLLILEYILYLITRSISLVLAIVRNALKKRYRGCLKGVQSSNLFIIIKCILNLYIYEILRAYKKSLSMHYTLDCFINL